VAATMGNLELGSDATVNTVGHGDLLRRREGVAGYTVELAAKAETWSGAKVDVSSPPGADAGRVIVRPLAL
jgi:hypothetical protein